MTPVAIDLPDTDWHVATLYDFVPGTGASMIVANYSRYVVDLNRGREDEPLYEGQVSTGLCPAQTCEGEALYRSAEPVGDDERRARIAGFWQPYHDRLAKALESARRRHGYALLWDAHSIPSRLPRLFDGVLPELNLGTFDGKSCAREIRDALAAVAATSAYESVVDGRFKGGYITRHYGRPERDIHAVQLEIAQRAYMSEDEGRYDADRAEALRDLIGAMLDTYTETAAALYA
jgi:N-formylglutamate amidohydrolase